MSLATDTIYRTILEVNATHCNGPHALLLTKLHPFCNTSSPDDGLKSERKYLENKQLWKIYQSIPAEYYKINTAICKDQQKNM